MVRYPFYCVNWSIYVGYTDPKNWCQMNRVHFTFTNPECGYCSILAIIMALAHVQRIAKRLTD
jgi:hypothetical protein